MKEFAVLQRIKIIVKAERERIMSRKNRVKVNISGEEFYIKGNNSVEHIKKVAEYVDLILEEITKSYPNLSSRKVALLAALNLTDELFKLEEQYNELLEKYKKLAGKENKEA